MTYSTVNVLLSGLLVVNPAVVSIRSLSLTTSHESLVTALSYDGLGRRSEKGVLPLSHSATLPHSLRYVYDSEDIVALYDQAGCWKQTIVHGPGIDDPIGFIQDTNDDCNAADAAGFPEPARVLNTDALGSITSLLSETSGFQRAIVLRERYIYDSFGNPTITDPNGTVLPSSGYGNLYFFTGREYDPETGLYYYRARYYNPRTGRFIQEDPIAGVKWNPKSLNRYPYVQNNPLTYIDPLGLFMVKSKIKEKLVQEGFGERFSSEELDIIAEEIDSVLNPLETAVAGNENITNEQAKEIANSCRAELRSKFDEKLEEILTQRMKIKPGSKRAQKLQQELDDASMRIRLLQGYDAAVEGRKQTVP